MKILRLIAVLALPLIFFSCSSTMKYVWAQEGYSGKHYDKILVVGVAQRLESRLAFENTVVKLLAAEGVTAETSTIAIPPVQNMEEVSKERFVKVVKEGNYDGVIVARLIDVSIKDVLESGSPSYGPMYAGRGYYGYGYGQYMYSGYNYMYTADYYRQEQTYVVETRLFDANAENLEKALVWSGQSNITDPSSYESGAASYAKTVVKTLLKSKMIEL